MNSLNTLLFLWKYLFSIFLSTVFLVSCLPNSISTTKQGRIKVDTDIKPTNKNDTVDTVKNPVLVTKINQSMTISGVAENAKLGAVILTSENVPVYMAGIEEWKSEILKKQVTVTGTLRLRKIAPDPVIIPNGEQSAGVEGESYILENPQWTINQ